MHTVIVRLRSITADTAQLHITIRLDTEAIILTRIRGCTTWTQDITDSNTGRFISADDTAY